MDAFELASFYLSLKPFRRHFTKPTHSSIFVIISMLFMNVTFHVYHTSIHCFMFEMRNDTFETPRILNLLISDSQAMNRFHNVGIISIPGGGAGRGRLVISFNSR